jgi:PAS domain S-box-containing protein
MELNIPGYKIAEKLHECSRTLVYRGQRIASGEQVILKVLRSDAVSEKGQSRFRQEYNLISQLHLPGVVRTIALEEYSCSPVMVMEDSGSTSLDRYPLPLPLEQFFRVAISLNDAMGQLHKQQIIHKDINPTNIIWNAETRQAQLIDFSLADVMPERTITPLPPSALEGTLEYVSPEQTGRMNRVVDYRTDYYSLGVTFYQLLTGRLPFSAHDALGVIHLHIAGTPVAPHEVNAAVPEMVSRIVLKLMAKMADDRYQCVWGLKADLERCFQEYTAKEVIQLFDLGKEDYTDRLRIPQKLYGREREVEQLLNAFEHVSAGECELLLIAGYAGIGKTALVHEVYRPIAEKKGYFIEGKFDLLQRNVPYYAWIQAFAGFVDYLLMESEADVAHWKASILNEIGSMGKVVTDVIPNLELIIGSQPNIPALGPTEAQNRFNYVFLGFIKSIATREHPLVVFLDDLQWIDTASLNMLQTLMSTVNISHILIIGAYRDNEVDALHPLTKGIESLRQEKVSVRLLTLGDLSEETVNEMIADTLHVEHSQTVPLTQLIYAKTGGNPFFMLHTLGSLAESELISYDTRSRRWEWDISALRSMEITNNVVTLMLGKIRKLPAETQYVLTLAACIGFRFSIANLSIIAEQSEDSTLANLHSALREGLIIHLDGTYQFVHDRVQEAAYALVPETRRKALHLKIGRLLLAQYPQEMLAGRVFEVVDHFNRSIELVTDAKERETLRCLNAAAGRKARAAVAYASAQRYLEQAMELLPPDHWNECYDESLTLFLKLAECTYFVGNFQRADALLTAALEMARTTLDLASIHRLRTQLYQLSGRYPEALEVVFEALRLFGVTFPEANEDIRMATDTELRLVHENMCGRSIADLRDIPLTRDAETLVLIGLLCDVSPLIYAVRPYIWTLFTAKAVNICLQRGHAAESSMLYSNHAMALTGDIRNILTAQQFSEMAIGLNAQTPGAGSVRGKVLFIHSTTVIVWRKHFNTSLPLLDQAFQASLDFGDIVLAVVATRHAVWLRLENGDPLERVVEVARRYVAFITQEIHSDVASHLNRLELQFALSLQGKTWSLVDFNDAAFDEASSVAALEQTGYNFGIAFYRVMKQIAAFIDERYEEALEWAVRIAPMQINVWAFANVATYHFYYALTLAALHAQAPAKQQRQFTQTIREILEKLKFWADNCPENFANRYFLVFAEIARIEGRDMEAMHLYDQAIRSARDNNFVQQEALAAEVASRYYRMRGFDRIADIYLHDARDCYARWGALGKVRQLERRYPWMTHPQQSGGEKLTEQLDLITVIKATQAISREIEMDRLLSEIMLSIIENAGAQSGFLLMERGGKWVVMAQGEIDSTEVKISPSISIEKGDIISLGVIRFVARTQKKVLLDNAASQGEFASDPHIRNERTKSLLCVPLLNRGKLIGILYLENNLATHAFTSDRVTLLEVLLSQVAISLENALVHEALRASESKYRSLIYKVQTAIVLYDGQGRILDSNPLAQELLGLSTDKLIGKGLIDPEWHFLREDGSVMSVDDYPVARVLSSRQSLWGYVTGISRPDRNEIAWVLVNAEPEYDAAGKISLVIVSFVDITERKQANATLHRLNRELRAISKCNQTLMRSDDEQILLNDICQIICDDAGYRMVWVGYADNDEAKTIHPVAWAGVENGYLKDAKITWADTEQQGRDPSGTSIRSGKYVYIQDFSAEPKMAPWRQMALKRGYRSSIALPLKDECENTFGVLNIYSSEPNTFTPDEIRLLEELVGDLAFGIVALRTRAKRKQAESQREDALEAMRKAKEQAEAANRYKTEFLTNISHELRTPLNAILGFAYILKSVDMAEEYRKSVDFINERGMHLLALVDDILDVTKMELGKTKPKSEEFDFKKLIENSIEAARVELGERNVTIFLSMKGTIPRLKGDALRVQQIVENIMNNAVKYTEHGEIKVTVEPDAQQPGEDKYRVRISVKDTGVGIPAEKLPYIFDPFIRFHEFYKGKTIKGVGLGLHIVLGLVRLMGGDIRVVSEVGKGSEFIVTLNFDKAIN